MTTRQASAISNAGVTESSKRENYLKVMEQQNAAAEPIVTAHSKKHSTLKLSVEEDFIRGLNSYGKIAVWFGISIHELSDVILLLLGPKYEWYLAKVNGTDTLSSKTEVERVFKVFASEKTVEGCRLLSTMLIDWMKVCKMAKPDKTSKCPYHKPSSTNQRLRTFFGSMKKLYCWPYVQKDLEGWDGCFGAWMEKEYARRSKEYVSVHFSCLCAIIDLCWA